MESSNSTKRVCMPVDMAKAKAVWPTLPDLPAPTPEFGATKSTCSVCGCEVWQLPFPILEDAVNLCIVCEDIGNKAEGVAHGVDDATSLGDHLLQMINDPSRDNLTLVRDGITAMSPEERDIVLRGAVTPVRPAMKTALTTLELDADAVGWDRPPRLYAVTGSLDDPTIEFMVEVYGNPSDELEKLVVAGDSMKDSVLGLVMMTEAYRHLHLGELPEDVLERVKVASAVTGMEPDQLWLHYCKSVGPSQMEPDMRREIRTVVAVYRDATGTSLERERGSDKILCDDQSLLATAVGRMTVLMWQLLTGGSRDDLAGMVYRTFLKGMAGPR